MARCEWYALLLWAALACGCALGDVGEGLGKLEGEECTLPAGGAGVCRRISGCPEAQEALRKGEALVVCSYEELRPVVCCANISAAARMCAKYGEAVFRYEKIPTIIPQTAKIDQCALKPSHSKRVRRVVGGEVAGVDEFPHMAAVGLGDADRKRWVCGGALISERYVLTAAQCLEDKSGRNGSRLARWVRLGVLNITADSTAGQEFSVIERIPHPEYKDRVKYFDIGLLKLDRDATFNGAVRPACLQAEADALPSRATVTGWGITTNGKASDVLLKASLALVSHDTCRQQYESFRGALPRGVTDDMLCAGGEPSGGRDACQGDSGGPLQVQRDEPYCTYSILGVTSFGTRTCGQSGFPGVYTRVAPFVPWLESVVWP